MQFADKLVKAVDFVFADNSGSQNSGNLPK